MESTQSKRTLNQKPERRSTDTAFDYPTSSKTPLKLCSPSTEPSMYGEAFQSLVAGRLATTADIPARPQVVDPETYTQRPTTWTDEMNTDFGLCEDTEERKSLIQRGYEKTCEEMGNMLGWTREDHQKMHRLCEGTVDDQGRRIRASAMLHEGNQESSYRAGFDQKYPYAYSTHDEKMRRQVHASQIRDYAPARASRSAKFL